MQKKLLHLLGNRFTTLKNRAKAKLNIQQHKTLGTLWHLLANLLTKTSIIFAFLVVIFLIIVTLSFSLSLFFGSHVKGFMTATFCLTLLFLIPLWKPNVLRRYFVEIGIARYFEKRNYRATKK